MSEYPEHDKLNRVKNQTQTIGEFLEWLGEQEYEICGTDKYDRYMPTPLTDQQLLAKYVGVDENKLELEKRKMLMKLREGNDEN
jgi:hypothetical protein